jgi:hypothetical protein
MSKGKQITKGSGNRWLRWALLTYTLTSPAIKAALERIRQRKQSLRGSAQTQQENARSAQADVINRMEDLTAESRQRVAQQVKRLRAQATQLEEQSRQLRKAVREEARQRRRLVKEMSKSGVDWSQDLLKQGGQFTEGIVERGGKIIEDVVEMGGKATQDVAERGSQVVQKFAKRSNKVTRDLAERGRTTTRGALQRGENFLQPVRKRRGGFWTLIGFGVGLLAATIITYRLVRRRVELQELEADQSIELPPSDIWNGVGSEVSRSQPAGEIRHVDDIGIAVATESAVDVEEILISPDASFVGIVSTRFYYPIGTSLIEVEDLVYFNSEEDAQVQGFTRAENSQ